jgi:hypothetical protein
MRADVMNGPATTLPAYRVSVDGDAIGFPRRHVAPRTGATFLVSGVSYRQDELRRAGVGVHQFLLVGEPDNPHDRHAVAVYCSGNHIGYISAKISKRWAEAITRIERDTGKQVWVHGAIEEGAVGLRAELDCPWPEEL